MEARFHRTWGITQFNNCLEKGAKCLKHKRGQTSGMFGPKYNCVFSIRRSWNRNLSPTRVELDCYSDIKPSRGLASGGVG